MSDITSKLKSHNAVVAVLVLALLAQMPHAQYVFFKNNHASDWFGWVQSWGGAIALEVAVLVFVIRGNTKVSWGFAGFSVAINLMYYYDITLSPYMSPVLLSVGLPLAIALYSHEVAEKNDTHATKQSEPAQPTSATIADDAQPDKIEPAQLVVEDEPEDDLGAQPVATIDAQPDATTPTQLDDIDLQIVDAVRNGNYTPYAISKVVPVALTTLKRKAKDGAYIGRIPNLVAAGVLHNGSGDNGNEYRLNGG